MILGSERNSGFNLCLVAGAFFGSPMLDVSFSLIPTEGNNGQTKFSAYWSYWLSVYRGSHICWNGSVYSQ